MWQSMKEQDMLNTSLLLDMYTANKCTQDIQTKASIIQDAKLELKMILAIPHYDTVNAWAQRQMSHGEPE